MVRSGSAVPRLPQQAPRPVWGSQHCTAGLTLLGGNTDKPRRGRFSVFESITSSRKPAWGAGLRASNVLICKTDQMTAQPGVLRVT